ncbi:MAG: ankyrin repeat domain-containing protein [Candidatus Hodarchaeota archaeon]
MLYLCPSVEGVTPLMIAVQNQNIDAIQFLIENGANVNKSDNRGFTSLHRSVEMGNTDITLFLLKNGANPKIKAQGHTPISLAEKRKQKEIVKIMKEILSKRESGN